MLYAGACYTPINKVTHRVPVYPVAPDNPPRVFPARLLNYRDRKLVLKTRCGKWADLQINASKVSAFSTNVKKQIEVSGCQALPSMHNQTSSSGGQRNSFLSIWSFGHILAG